MDNKNKFGGEMLTQLVGLSAKTVIQLGLSKLNEERDKKKLQRMLFNEVLYNLKILEEFSRIQAPIEKKTKILTLLKTDTFYAIYECGFDINNIVGKVFVNYDGDKFAKKYNVWFKDDKSLVRLLRKTYEKITVYSALNSIELPVSSNKIIILKHHLLHSKKTFIEKVNG